MMSPVTRHTAHIPSRGFVLSELLVALALLVTIALVLGSFQADIFALYGTTRDSLSVQQDVRHFLKTIVDELRAAQASDLGGFPLASAATSTLIFYSDVDHDGDQERVRYFVESRTVKRGVTKSSGTPLAYSSQNEQVVSEVSYLTSTTTPLFTYYGSGYTPATSPLPLPIDVQAVRLVKIEVSADVNAERAPVVISGATQVSIRNLKDNL